MTGSDGMQGGGQRGEDDHNDGSNALSPNNDNNGADKEEAAVNIVEDEGEDSMTGSTSICRDDAATMMDAPPLSSSSPGIAAPAGQQNGRCKDAAVSATTAAKVGIVARATSSSGAVMNTMDIIAWRQSPKDINNNEDDNDQCQ